MRKRWLCIFLLLAGTPCVAAELHVGIVDQRGKPVADAVVTVLPATRTPAQAPAPASRTKTINQSALTFVPYIEVFRPGDQVVFHNSDKTRHHVYSFSTVKAFEFMLNPGESSTALVLEKSGVVAVGCNIHDSMITYLYVTDAPWVVRTSPSGKAVVRGLPAGTYTVRVWQPRLRPGKPDLVESGVVVTAQGNRPLQFKVNLLPDSRRKFDREQTRY